MSGDVDLSKLRKWIGKAKNIGEPPSADKPAERQARKGIVQLNLKVPADVKRRMKHLAARDDINLATLLTRMVDLYETDQGALPEIKTKAR
jgi:hypothetical protein